MAEQMIRIHNLESDEIIDRPMTDEELANFTIINKQAENERNAELAKATAKAALLERLGITEEEAKLLLG
jgi:hypothetical protein